MISFFRHHLQGRFLRYTVYLVSFLVIFPFSLNIFFRWFNVGGANWIVSVNGVKADFTEYQNREQEVIRQIETLKSMLGDKAQAILAAQGLAEDPKTIALNSLTMEMLFKWVAKKMDLFIAPSYAHLYLLKQLPRNYLLPNGEINQALIEQTYHKSLEQFEKEQQERLQQELIVQLNTGALYLPTFILKDYFMREYTPHKFLIAQFPLTRFIEYEKKQPISAQELQEFFTAQNRKTKRYFVPERRSATLWSFEPAQYGITITDNQVKRYYDRNKHTDFVATPVQMQVRHILISFTEATKHDTRIRMNQLRQELIKDPSLFEQKARELSQDSATKNKGGLLDFFAKGTKEPAFEQEAFRLTTDGAISPVFETSKGFHIVQRVERKAPTYKSLDSVRREIEHKLQVEQFAYSFPHMIRRIAAQENKEQALTDFARERNAKKQVITNSPIDQTPLMQKLFSIRKGGIGSLIDGEHGFVVFVTDVTKAYEPNLDQIKNQVLADCYHSRAERALKNLLHKADSLTTVEAFKKFVQEQGGHIEPTGFIIAHEHDKLKKLNEIFGQAISRLFAMSLPGSVMVYLGKDAGYAVCLEAIAPFEQQAFQAHKNEIALAALQSQRALIEQGFVASLCKTATIKVNEKLRMLYKG